MTFPKNHPTKTSAVDVNVKPTSREKSGATMHLAHPLVASSGKRGKTKQSQAANLLRRLRTHADDVWLFASDPAVPFTNNLAEQSVRMPKVKQKISGSFRTKAGAQRFCVIRSYLETMRKQGQKLFGSLVSALQGKVVQPNLS